MRYALYLCPLIGAGVVTHTVRDPFRNALSALIDIAAGEGYHDCLFDHSKQTLCVCWATPATHAAILADGRCEAFSPPCASEDALFAWLDAHPAQADAVRHLRALSYHEQIHAHAPVSDQRQRALMAVRAPDLVARVPAHQLALMGRRL